MSSQRQPRSPRRVVSGGDARIVAQKGFSPGPSSFSHFNDAQITFVDKTLAIEAFLRHPGSHHLILRPRRCGKSFTLSMIQEFLQQPLIRGPSCRDITTTQFAGTAISEHNDLVSQHFQQYPVLYIDLKDVGGIRYEDMLASFDRRIRQIYRELIHPYSDLVDNKFGKVLFGNGGLERDRDIALQIISLELRRVYQMPVVVLIDEYDSPMHSATEHGYSHQRFFAEVFGSLLKNNRAVYASMMIFPMHAEDDRYAKFFLFTEEEVKILRHESGRELSLESLREHYNGYTAKCDSGLVKLYNPLSVVEALANNKISNYWVETGRYSPLSTSLWRASGQFRTKITPLLAGDIVELEIDEHVDYSSLNTISDPGLWGLLYYTGYLSIENFGDSSVPGYSFRIPNREVTSQWRDWVMDHLVTGTTQEMTRSYFSGLRNIILDGNAEGFQTQLTAFLQERLSLFCIPSHKERVYQTLCFMLFFTLFPEHDVRMEQDAGHGRSDIVAHPLRSQRLPELLWEIKSINRKFKRGGKQSIKDPERIKKDMSSAKIRALEQLENRRYREGVPLHVTNIHEFGLVFCGKFCATAVRTLKRNYKGLWEQVSVVSGGMVDVRDAGDECFADADVIMGTEDVGDESEET